MALKSKMQHDIVNTATRHSQVLTTIGYVESSDDANNTCTLFYKDKSGKNKRRENVVVRLYGSGTDWFPTEGDQVVVQDTGDTCTVIARHVGNYNMDVRSKMSLRQDVYSDESGAQPTGGSIF